MSGARELVSKVSQNNIVNNALSSSYGIVLKSDEKENICDITYINRSGKMVHRSNVEVKMWTKKDDWFPKPGELVITQESNDNSPVIIGQLIRDYIRDVKPERTYEKDVQAGRKYQTRNKIVG